MSKSKAQPSAKTTTDMALPSYARLAASLAVARSHCPLKANAALLYRLLELMASAILPAGMCWVVDPAAMVPLFVVFWFLPAAWRAKSVTKPVTQPILCFVVDDVSLLGLHPTPRPSRIMYLIGIVRVCMLFAIIPLFSDASPLPQGFKDLVMNRKALATFNSPFFNEGNLYSFFGLDTRTSETQILGEQTGSVPLRDWFFNKLGIVTTTIATTTATTSEMHIWDLWLAACTFVMVLSAVWVVVTLCMLLLTSVFSGSSEKLLLAKIYELAGEIQQASLLAPEECKQQLQKIQSTHPRLQLASLFNTVGPAWACVLHLGMDIGNVFTLGMHGKWTLALPLAIFVCFSLLHLCRAAIGGPLNLAAEVKTSLKRGLVTEHWMEAIRGDKAVLRIPETLLKIYGLPFAAKSLMSVLAAGGSIAGNVVLVAKFVYTDFDLGIESFGMDNTEKGKTD